VSTNSAHTGGLTALLQAQQTYRTTGMRILDAGGIEVFDCGLQLVANGTLVPPNPIYNPGSDKWHFTSQTNSSWNAAQAFCTQLGGNLVTISSDYENQWIQAQYPADYFLGLTEGYLGVPRPQQLDPASGSWVSGNPSTYRNWASGQPAMWATTSQKFIVTFKDTTGHWFFSGRQLRFNSWNWGSSGLGSVGGAAESDRDPTPPLARF